MGKEKLHHVGTVWVPDVSTAFDTSSSYQPGARTANSDSLQCARSQAHQHSLLHHNLFRGMEVAKARGQRTRPDPSPPQNYSLLESGHLIFSLGPRLP